MRTFAAVRAEVCLAGTNPSLVAILPTTVVGRRPRLDIQVANFLMTNRSKELLIELKEAFTIK